MKDLSLKFLGFILLFVLIIFMLNHYQSATNADYQPDITSHSVYGNPETSFGAQPFVTILCRFGDSTNATPHDVSWYEELMGNTYPGMDHYWQEVSYGNINLNGSKVVGWYDLPHPKSYYSNVILALEDCTNAADLDIFFPNFVGIILFFNDEISYGQAGSHFLDKDGQNRAYKIIWLGTEDEAQGEKAQGGLAHEMGHTFGLYHTDGVDIMNGWFGSIDTNFGQVAVHTNSFHKDLLGWIPPAQKYISSLGSQVDISLEQLALPQSNNYLMAQIPSNDPEIDFYTVEARRFSGYDQGAYAIEGVLIHKVKLDSCANLNSFISQIVINPDTSHIWWDVGETFIDSSSRITISVKSMNTTGFDISIEHAPTLTEQIYLPIITTGSPFSQESILCIDSIWTAEGNGTPKSIFNHGDNIIYNMEIVNPTPIALLANINLFVDGPCGSIFSTSADIGISAGNSTYPFGSSVPNNACPGTYTYTLTLTHAGSSTTKSIPFTVE